MMLFLTNLPEELSNDILLEWIERSCLRNLDSACCNQNDRQTIFRIFYNDAVFSDLYRSSETNTLANNLVRLLLDISDGNVFWNKAITSFAKEHGICKLEEELFKEDFSPKKSLKRLIKICFEKLPPEIQKVLRYFSVFGDQFSMNLFHAILPDSPKLKELEESFKNLIHRGFIHIKNPGQPSYGFCSSFVRNTIYEMMPVRCGFSLDFNLLCC
jgi:hypothetical protein